MKIKPFAALCPAPARAASVAALPYDVMDTSEARTLAAGNPDSFLRVSRPEIDLPASIDIHDDVVYAQGVKNLRDFQARGVLIREPGERLYIYRQVMGAHSQTGLVTCCHIDDYAQDVIRKHEKTRKDKEDDRTRHCLELNANSGLVFLTYRGVAAIDCLVAQTIAGVPLYDFTAVDGIRHTVWRVAGAAEPWIQAFAAVPCCYVADGHHRAAAAARAGRMRRESNPKHTGCEEYNWFLAALFPAAQLRILPYNRCVRDLNGLSPEAFLQQVGRIFTCEPASAAEPAGPRQVHMYFAGRWYRLSWPEVVGGDPVGRLDVSVLQNRLLASVLGIDDPRTSQRISFVGGIRGTSELVKRVDSGREAVAFSLYPVSVDQMMDIADAGQIMPPKSTWFEPKLRSGLLVHTLE